MPDGGQKPAGRRTGRWTAIITAIVAVLVAAGITTFLLMRGEPPADNGSDTGGSSSSTGEAQAAYRALPRTGALPDTTMVVSRLVDGNVDVYLLDGTTGAVGQQLTTAPEEDLGVILSPDRRTIIYLRKPDSGPSELRTMAIDGTADRPLFDHPLDGCANPGRPAWNKAEPTEIALACYDDPERTTLRLLSFDGVTIRDLPAGRAKIDDLTFSPDGTGIAFWGGDVDSGSGAIFTVAADGQSDPVQLTTTAADNDVVWSPDGDQLAFSRTIASGKRQIVLMAPKEGAEEHPITSGDYVDQGPSWSPDGSHIAYKSNQATDAGSSGDHWWVMNADGSEQKVLETAGKAVASPAWGNR